MSLISQPRRRGEAAASPQNANPTRPRSWTLSALHRNVAGSIAVSLLTQLGLLMSGVAGARILGVLDRGRSALLLLFATVLPLLGTLGTPLALTYWIARDKRVGLRLFRQLRRLVVGQTGALLLVHACVLFVVFRTAPTHVQVAAALSLLGTPSIVAFFYALAVLQGTQDFRALNLCRLIFPPVNAAVLIVMLVTGVGGLWLVTIVWVALYSLSALIAALAARRALISVSSEEHDPGSVPQNGEMVKFGLKALLGSMSPLTGFQLDQAVVGLFISQAALGIYVVAVAFTNLPRFVAQSIGIVAYPHVAADGSGRSQARAIITFTGLTLLLCGIVVGATELALGFLVPHLFGSAFASAVGVGRILLISSLFFCLTRVLSDCARGAGRPSLGTVAEVVSLVLLFPFVALLSTSGAKGVALALVLASAAGVISIVIGLMIPARRPRASGGSSRRSASPVEASLAAAGDSPPAAVEA